jgi:Flp pilus assembly protein TadB
MDDSSSHLRLSDVERDDAVSELSTHFQAGRLTMEEFSERSDQALRAKTRGDLTGLFTDLPSAPVPAPALAAVPASQAGRQAVQPVLVGVAALALVTVLSVAASLQAHHTVVILTPIILWLVFFRRLARRRSPMIRPPR